MQSHAGNGQKTFGKSTRPPINRRKRRLATVLTESSPHAAKSPRLKHVVRNAG